MCRGAAYADAAPAPSLVASGLSATDSMPWRATTMRRIGRALMVLASQETARANAARASAALRGRRREREEVAAYLDALDEPLPRRLPGADQIRGHLVELHVAPLGDPAENGERLVRGDAEAFHQDSFGTPDDGAVADRQLQVLDVL